jgi:opacity protein-like surface antigen
MRSFLLAASLVALTAAPAFAADDMMAPYYGNTVIATGGMADTHSNYNADHSFVMNVPSLHMTFKGTWKLDGGNMCRTFDSPPPGAPNPLCVPMTSHKVGDNWTVTIDGKSRAMTLAPGIQ